MGRSIGIKVLTALYNERVKGQNGTSEGYTTVKDISMNMKLPMYSVSNSVKGMREMLDPYDGIDIMHLGDEDEFRLKMEYVLKVDKYMRHVVNGNSKKR